MNSTLNVQPFEQLRNTDVESVGGKNASLGEMISQLATAGVRVPTGFATTAQAFRDFLHHNHLTERIAARLDGLNVDDVRVLAQVGEEIRSWVIDAPLQPALEADIRAQFAQLTQNDAAGLSFAVRSSATAEDLPDASRLQGSKRVTSMSQALTMCSIKSNTYLPRSTTTVRLPIACTKAFTHAEVALSAGFNAWCARTSCLWRDVYDGH